MGQISDFVERIETASGISRDAFELNGLNNADRSASDLNDEFVELLYGDFDGQSDSGLKLFGEFRFLPLKFAQYYASDDVFGEFKTLKIECSDERLKDGFAWRDQWIPFAVDINFNNALILDFDPSEKGTIGQVFCIRHCDRPGEYLASSLSEFLDNRFERLIETNFEIEGNNFARVIPL